MKKEPYSELDLSIYSRLIQFAGKISGLFSDNKTPLIDYRFVEKAFVAVTNSRDISRKDISYDAKMPNGAGVGVKTFGFSPKSSSKQEKIAEFTKDAKNGAFTGLPAEALAFVVADLRNARLMSDAAEMRISLEESFYHCLLRGPGSARVHEEEMSTIEVDGIFPISSAGKRIARFPSGHNDHVRFGDGQKDYLFNRSKNTLFQRFRTNVGFTSVEIGLSVIEDIWGHLISGKLDEVFSLVSQPVDDYVPEHVVLPLYSTKSSSDKQIAARSGINQWNAGGRKRIFGESYIPIPRIVHKLMPGFFPPRDEKFELGLPSGELVSAKVCQDGSKALMSDPNDVLCRWLFTTIDGNYAHAESRLGRAKPYTYGDLARIGKDAVKVTRAAGSKNRFHLEFSPIGSFEEFVAGLQEFDDLT